MQGQKSDSLVSASAEDYLEAIFRITTNRRVARSKEIAEAMGVTKSSVTTALKQLSASGLVNYDPYSYVTLTKAGEDIGRSVEERHQFLAGFLEKVLGVDAQRADQNACRLEHVLDKEVYERLTAFACFLEAQGITSETW
ncbi:MAG TPA: metal-dependent transcriptional regulator, partial [Candidatus Hydrogenedentes bacterium]|nr:metal-dependent transcriptional regulator [Candidatus Hydrogenedentota bacterium]